MNSIHLPGKIYVRVWAALLALLLLTWGLAETDLGPFNNVAALAISATKMMLVVLFFMHVRYESKLTWVFVAAGLIWLLIMVDLTLSDYLTRGQVQPNKVMLNPALSRPVGDAGQKPGESGGAATVSRTR